MKDYMESEVETKKQPDALPWLRQIANGDQAVFGLVWSLWNMAHVWDDLIDESNWSLEKKEQAYKALEMFTSNLLLNPFVHAHNAELRALLTSAIARQIGGDHIATVPAQRQHAPATRCADIDIFVHIAGLHLGWDKMIEFSKQREIDKEDK